MPTKILLDCDTGIDDAIAILYAALVPKAQILAAGGVWGNAPVDIATRNTRRVLDLAGLTEVPVAQGTAAPIDGSPPVFAPHVHGEDGQGNVDASALGIDDRTDGVSPVHAAVQISQVVRDHPGEVEIVAVGPLTNIAVALSLDPQVAQLARGITIMGGAADAPGNVTPKAEANIACDPIAAHAVFAADWRVTMLPLDVTMRVRLTETHRQLLADGPSLIGRYVAAITDHYFNFFADAAFGERSSAMHDVLAVGVAIGTLQPQLSPVVVATVDTSHGPSRGATVCDLRGMYAGYPDQPDARCRVVLEVENGFNDRVVDVLRTGAADMTSDDAGRTV